jgi:hypothetical protein
VTRAAAIFTAALALALASAASASAQDLSDVLISLSPTDSALTPANLISQTSVPVAVSGGLAVDYQGSPSAGCAAMGLCGVRGSVTWDPGSRAFLSVTTYLRHGKRRLQAYLAFLPDGRPATAAVVTDAAGGVCGDTLGGVGGYPQLTTRSLTALQLRLVDEHQLDFLSTRCAGPAYQDMVALLPVQPLPRAILHGGTRLVDLSTERAFSAHGFSGTLRSTVKLRIGPSRGEERLRGRFGHSSLRSVDISYRVTRVSGGVRVAFRGEPGRCVGLDACGTSGTLTVSPGTSRGRFDVSAVGGGTQPWSELLSALHLTGGRRSHDVFVGGTGRWSSPSGTLAAGVSDADSGAACHDAVPLGRGLLIGAAISGRFVVQYVDYAGLGLPAHTRCAGPLLSDAASENALASGSVPLSALRRKVITVRLNRGSRTHAAAGYVLSSRSSLTLRLRRASVRRHVFPY